MRTASGAAQCTSTVHRLASSSHHLGAQSRLPAPSSPGEQRRKGASADRPRPLTPSSMCRPYCGWSTLGRLNTLTPAKRASTCFHQRRQRGLHRAEDDDRALAPARAAVQARRSGCPAPTRSSARPSPESRARSAPSPTEKPGILLYGLGMISRALREHAHVQPVQVVGRARARRAGPARRATSRMRSRISSRACGCSASGTPSAAAAHWRVWSSGVAPMPPQQNTTSPLAKASRSAAVMQAAVVADVARPGQRQAARGQQLDDLGQVLVLALAGQDFVADDDQAEVHGGGGSAAVALACRCRRRRGGGSGTGSAGSSPVARARRRCSAASAIVREPQRGEGKHQRVQPHRQQHQHRRQAPAWPRSTAHSSDGAAPR